MVVLVFILIIINLLSLFLFFVDKQKSIKNKNRISEKSLMIISIFAPLGSILGMNAFHHKTKKIKFKFIYIFLLIHLILIYIYFNSIVAFLK